MVNPILPVIVGVIGAAITGLVAWSVAKRQRSGKIDTTEAETLWAEGQAMRHELREENFQLRTEVLALRAEITAWRVEAVALRVKVEALARQVESFGGTPMGNEVKTT